MKIDHKRTASLEIMKISLLIIVMDAEEFCNGLKKGKFRYK